MPAVQNLTTQGDPGYRELTQVGSWGRGAEKLRGSLSPGQPRYHLSLTLGTGSSTGLMSTGVFTEQGWLGVDYSALKVRMRDGGGIL